MKKRSLISIFITLVFMLCCAYAVNAASYEYDALGRLVEVDYSKGKIANYSYDAGGNIVNVNGFTGESSTEPPTETTTESTNEYVWNYSNNENTDNFFSVTANEWGNAVSVVYGDLTLTRAIKMESNSSISFTAAKEGTLRLVTYSTKTNPAVLINGTSYPISANGETEIEIPETGLYTITKDTTNTYLYYMSFETEADTVTDVSYIWNHTDETNTDDFYSVTANEWGSAITILYNNMSLSRAVKMESNSYISFTTPTDGTLTLVTYSSQANPMVKVNGTNYAVSANGATEIELAANTTYTITKGTTNTYLYYMSFEN